jgi:hypothetical protein
VARTKFFHSSPTGFSADLTTPLTDNPNSPRGEDKVRLRRCSCLVLLLLLIGTQVTQSGVSKLKESLPDIEIVGPLNDAPGGAPVP